MYVKKAVYDEWKNNIDIGGAIEGISWNIAEKLIKSLDGSKYTQVINNGDLSNILWDSPFGKEI